MERTGTRFPPDQCTSAGQSALLIKAAPKPKPMMTKPVARPLWSGNHLATVATGVT